jgi:predicted enzyme related to lactoylglutathione lyase
LGGEVTTPPTDISNGGKWAVLKDPQGNEFGLYWSPNNPRPEMNMQPGEFHWHELATDDYKTVFSFYQQLFGWEPAREHDMGNMGMYALFKNEGRPQGLGGMFNKPAGMPHGGWCTYTIVKDVGKAAAAIKRLGGKITHEPVQVPGGSWTLKFTDAQGIPHALTSTENVSARPAATKMERKKKIASSAAKPKAKAKHAVSKTAPAKKSAKKSAGKSVKKKAVKKPAAKKVAYTRIKLDAKQLKKARKKEEKKKKKELKKQKKLEKKLKKKEKKAKKKEKAAAKK